MTIWAESALREAKVVLWLLEHVFGLFIRFLLRLFPETPNIIQRNDKPTGVWTVQYANAVIKTVFVLGSVL